MIMSVRVKLSFYNFLLLLLVYSLVAAITPITNCFRMASLVTVYTNTLLAFKTGWTLRTARTFTFVDSGSSKFVFNYIIEVLSIDIFIVKSNFVGPVRCSIKIQWLFGCTLRQLVLHISFKIRDIFLEDSFFRNAFVPAMFGRWTWPIHVCKVRNFQNWHWHFLSRFFNNWNRFYRLQDLCLLIIMQRFCLRSWWGSMLILLVLIGVSYPRKIIEIFL